MTNSSAIGLVESSSLAGRGSLIAASFAIHTTLGALFAWSVFLGPLRSLCGWDETTLLTPYRYALVWFTVGLLAASQLARRQSPRALARLGALCLVSGSLCAAAVGQSLGGLTMGIGVLGGFGAGVAYLAPISTFRHWLPQRSGIFFAFSVLCFGAGTFLAAPFLEWMLGQQAARYAATVPATFLAMALLFLLGVAVMGEFLPGTRAWLAPRVFETLRGETVACETARQRAWDQSVMPLLRLWLQWGVFFAGAFAGVVALDERIPFLNAVRWHEAWLATGVCVAVLAVTNRVGRRVWEGLAHQTGRISAFLVQILLATGLSMIANGGPPEFSSTMAMLALIGFGFGGFLGLMPQLAAEMVDGRESLALTFGIMNSAFGLWVFAAPFWLHEQRPETLLGSVSLLTVSAAFLLGFVYLLLRPAKTGSCVSQALSRW
ncbi:MAG: MFS transporter [Bryobacterales bacterium]|nr:MFS transporter [Bryobacterales bacterium]